MTEPPSSAPGGSSGAAPRKPLVGGRYELDGLLGRGGMAEVRKGCDLRLGRTVAVKRLRTDLASDATFQARFRREAQSAASLNHPAIVSVYDTGDEPAADGSGLSVPYIVMEFVEGRTLRDIMRDGRRILPERALEITAGVLSALDYSHRAGIVHRDIKPANVMLTPPGDVKVMDFGIARALADSSATMTQTAAVIGTAQYLSPEQARGEQVDARSDIYSAGCLLYELLTGRPPFVGDSPVSVAYQHVREEPLPPSSLDPDIPAEIDAITLKALAKSTSSRYQSAAEMRADIERALAGQQVSAPAAPTDEPTATLLPPEPTTQQLGATAVVPAAVVADDQPRRRTLAYVLLGVGVLIVFGLIGYLGPKLFSANSVPKVSVPQLIGMPKAEAKATLLSKGLTVGKIRPQYGSTYPVGNVARQDPGRGAFLARHRPVDLWISAGRRQVNVPTVANLRIGAATRVLLRAHLQPRPVGRHSLLPQGEVIRTTPGAGTPVPRGSLVTVYFSTGPVPPPPSPTNSPPPPSPSPSSSPSPSPSPTPSPSPSPTPSPSPSPTPPTTPSASPPTTHVRGLRAPAAYRAASALI